MRPTFRTFLCLSPLALAVAALLLARAGLGGPDHEPLPEPWPLTAPDQPFEEVVRWADRRAEAKGRVACALVDGRMTLPQAAACFLEIDADLPDEARGWRPAAWTEEEWTYRQVISFVHTEVALNRRDPAKAQEWVTRLVAEMREHQRHDSAPRLQRGP
jgi:hypothetical protein